MAQNEATLLIRIKQMGIEALDKISEGLEVMRGMVLAVGTAIVGFSALAIHAFKESEEASNALAQSMVNQGVYTTDLKKKYDEMATSLAQVTTYQDDQITSAQAILQAQVGQIEVSEELVKATLDLAAAKKIDLASAAEMVGKSIGTETNALARQGLQLNDTMNSTEKMAKVLEFINGKWSGQAEAQAKGLGVLVQLKNAMAELTELAGSQLAPVVVAVARELLSMTNEIMKSTGAFDGLKFIATETAVMFNGVISYIMDMGQGIGATLGAIAGAAGLVMKGQFGDAAKFLKESNAEINKMHEDNEKAAVDRANRIRGSQAQIQEEIAQEELNRVKRSEENKQVVRDEAHATNMIKAMTEAQEMAALQAGIEVAEMQVGEGARAAVLQAQMAFLDKKIQNETNAQAKVAMLKSKGAMQEQLIEEQKNMAMAKNRDQFLSQIATMQSAHNGVMATIGKAAAIAMITINTGDAAMSGYKWGMALGGPPLAAAFAGLAVAAGAMQAARVAGIQLADGGIVRAQPGGIQATIGEGGQDEMVVPLDRAAEMGFGGGGLTVNFNGPILGNESQAMEFARALDKQFLKLRQTGQSVAFETDIF